MKEYIISVIAAALLSGLAVVLSPEKWKKYVGIISGVVILCTVIAPVSKIDLDDIFASFESVELDDIAEEGEEYQEDMVKTELTRRINSDIEERLKSEFGIVTKANAVVGVNEEGKITGVTAIEIDGRLSERAAMRLREVYGVEEITAANGSGFFEKQE